MFPFIFSKPGKFSASLIVFNKNIFSEFNNLNSSNLFKFLLKKVVNNPIIFNVSFKRFLFVISPNSVYKSFTINVFWKISTTIAFFINPPFSKPMFNVS